jgi:hypothetical protein
MDLPANLKSRCWSSKEVDRIWKGEVLLRSELFSKE